MKGAHCVRLSYCKQRSPTSRSRRPEAGGGHGNRDLHRIDVQAVVALTLRYQLSAYDAAYRWLAAELKAPLATFDETLAATAKTHLASLS